MKPLYKIDNMPVMRNGKVVYLKEYIEEVRIKGFATGDCHVLGTMDIIVRTLDNKKIQIKTTGRMTIGEIIEAIVREVK